MYIHTYIVTLRASPHPGHGLAWHLARRRRRRRHILRPPRSGALVARAQDNWDPGSVNIADDDGNPIALSPCRPPLSMAFLGDPSPCRSLCTKFSRTASQGPGKARQRLAGLGARGQDEAEHAHKAWPGLACLMEPSRRPGHRERGSGRWTDIFGVDSSSATTLFGDRHHDPSGADGMHRLSGHFPSL